MFTLQCDSQERVNKIFLHFHTARHPFHMYTTELCTLKHMHEGAQMKKEIVFPLAIC